MNYRAFPLSGILEVYYARPESASYYGYSLPRLGIFDPIITQQGYSVRYRSRASFLQGNGEAYQSISCIFRKTPQADLVKGISGRP
jgi:hypothetical protein